MKRKFRLDWQVFLTALAVSAVAATGPGFAQEKRRHEMGLGGSALLVHTHHDFPLIGFVSYSSGKPGSQFELAGYFTIPPAPGLLLSANMVQSMKGERSVAPYFTIGAGIVIGISYLAPVANAGAGLKIRASPKVTFSIDYRYWFTFAGGGGGIGMLNAGVRFRL